MLLFLKIKNLYSMVQLIKFQEKSLLIIMDKKIKSNVFYSWISPNKNYRKLNPWIKWTISALILILIILSFVNVGFKITPNGTNVFFENIKQLFNFSDNSKYFPNQSLWNVSFNYLLLTIKQTLIGTITGFALALISSYLSFKNFTNKYTSYFINLIVNVLRFVPILFFIYYIQLSFSKELGLFIVLLWFTWLWSHKYLIEIYRNIDYSLYFQKIVEGNNKFISFWTTVFYQVNTRIISLFLFSFESNVRWSTILGSLGLIGIGQLIQQGTEDFSTMGIPVLMISLFLIFLEIFIYVFKKILIEEKIPFLKNNWNQNQYLKFRKFKKIFSVVIFVVLISFIFYCFTTTDFNSLKTDSGWIFLSAIFSPDWNILNSSSLTIPIWNQILNLFSQAIVAVTISLLFLLITLFLGNKFLFRKTYFVMHILNSIVRAIPAVAILFIVDSIYFDTSSALTIALSVSLATSLFKVINEKSEKLNEYNIQIMFLTGHSRLMIFKNYILFKLKNDILTVGTFEFENTFRNLIIYGSYSGASEISSQLDYFFKRSLYDKMGAFLWLIFILIMLLNIVLSIFRIFYINDFRIGKQKFLNLKSKIKRSIKWKTLHFH
ncbi:ABC thiamine transporter permease subunit [Malacoplasma iowae DK-CPA]|uniref:ABC thiamine transporter permease subunit n=2 Tax=Malacoplasma iowae TaxID=2116 RepID=A0A084U495_MALIO|nr:ABC thiamine transporter permease subunit [Malacoplasma iowae DK-CPA]